MMMHHRVCPLVCQTAVVYSLFYHPICRFFHVTPLRQNLTLACTVLHTVHVTGIPWWLSISLTTLLLRTAMLPIVLWSRNRMIRYACIKPIIQAWMHQNMRISGIRGVDIKKMQKVGLVSVKKMNLMVKVKTK